jgi:hypothetical protein
MLLNLYWHKKLFLWMYSSIIFTKISTIFTGVNNITRVIEMRIYLLSSWSLRRIGVKISGYLKGN